MHTFPVHLPADHGASARLVLDAQLTNDELWELCRRNDLAQIERTREGYIVMNAPEGGSTGDGNAEIIAQLRNWWKTHRRGRVYDSNTGFELPDGSMLSPDAAYLTSERLFPLTPAERRRFLPACPNFIIELLSPSDRLPEIQQK